MRFRKSEYDAFVKVIESKGLDASTFTWNKKGGWLTISNNTGPLARYHRKTESYINDQGQFDQKELYYLEVNKDRQEFKHLKDLLEVFGALLKSIA